VDTWAIAMKKLRFQIERILFILTVYAARLFPRKLFLKIGKSFGSLAHLLDSRHRKIALSNISKAMPELSKEECEHTIRECYRWFGMYLFDLLHSIRGYNPKFLEKCEYEGLEHLDAAYAKKKGVLLYTAHYGGWEVNAQANTYKGFPLNVIARELDNPHLEKLLTKFRTGRGTAVIDKKDGFRPMLRTLKEGKGVAILIDQNVTTEDRIFVDFFGRPASTTPALALLKLKTDADIIPCFAIPLPDGHYRFRCGAPVQVDLTGDRKEDVFRITQACTKIIEDEIRLHPQYWLWMHRRWKTQPSTKEIIPEKTPFPAESSSVSAG
jgi:Kdo2-lipid IVA lauroyltransferase/acyltransferase